MFSTAMDIVHNSKKKKKARETRTLIVFHDYPRNDPTGSRRCLFDRIIIAIMEGLLPFLALQTALYRAERRTRGARVAQYRGTDVTRELDAS